jgi:hypothetical protein
MLAEREIRKISVRDLANIGSGHIAYMRRITGEEITKAFPNTVEIAPTAQVWALFAADGTPLVLSDNKGEALAGAFDNDLVPVAVH